MEKRFIVPIPSKVIWDNGEWIITHNKDEYTLLPCRKSTNNGEIIKLPLDTPFGAFYPINMPDAKTTDVPSQNIYKKFYGGVSAEQITGNNKDSMKIYDGHLKNLLRKKPF